MKIDLSVMSDAELRTFIVDACRVFPAGQSASPEPFAYEELRREILKHKNRSLLLRVCRLTDEIRVDGDLTDDKNAIFNLNDLSIVPLA